MSAILKNQGYGPVKIVLLDAESNREEMNQKRSLADLTRAEVETLIKEV